MSITKLYRNLFSDFGEEGALQTNGKGDHPIWRSQHNAQGKEFTYERSHRPIGPQIWNPMPSYAR